MKQVRVYNMGNPAVNYAIEEGSSIRKVMEENDIVPKGAYTLSIDNKTVNLDTELTGGENLVIAPNNLKGGA